MARKVLTMIKLQIPAGAANPAPPVGPALGQHGVNIMEFCKAFNAQTQADAGTIIPVEITVYEDRSFTFITKTPPAAVLIKQAIGIEKGSGRAEPREGRHDQPRPGAPDRRDEDAGPERQRRRPGDEDHRGHRPLDGSGCRDEARASATAACASRSTACASTRRPRRSRPSRRCSRPSSPRRSRSTSASASTCATPTSRCAARWCCRTASAATSPWRSSPRATRPGRPRPPAPTPSAARTSPSASAAAGPTSTSRSRRPT